MFRFFLPEIRLLLIPLLAFAAGCAAVRSEAASTSTPGSRPNAAPAPVEHALDEPSIQPLTGEGIDELVAWAEVHHPRLRAARQRWLGALAQAETADALPEPRLAYREYIEEVETRAGPMRRALGLQQPLPAFGSRSLRRDAALATAAAAGARMEAERLAVRADIARAHGELYHLGRTTEFVRVDVQLLGALERVLRARFGAGDAPHTDLARAQVELGRLADRLQDLEERAGPARATLNAAMGRQVSAPLAWPTELTHARLSDPDERVLRSVEEANPQLTALAAELVRARALVQLTATRRLPKTTLGLEAIQIDAVDGSDGSDAWVFSLGLELPLRRRVYRAEERAARAALGAAAGTLDDRRNILGARARTVLSRLHDAERKLDLYAAALIPKARESLEASQAAFGTGTSDLEGVIDAQRTLLEFHLTRERALTDHQRLRAELESLSGRTLETERSTR
jgi:outer membrane protein TolC